MRNKCFEVYSFITAHWIYLLSSNTNISLIKRNNKNDVNLIAQLASGTVLRKHRQVGSGKRLLKRR